MQKQQATSDNSDGHDENDDEGDDDEDEDEDGMPEAIAWGLEVEPIERRGSSSRRGWVWEAGVTTDPLEYPTAAVRRGVVRFHEKV